MKANPARESEPSPETLPSLPEPETTTPGFREGLVNLLLFLLLLYCFLTAIDMMSLGFKLLGKDVAKEVMTFTTNPFAGLFIGILATACIQSSSVTTSMTVGLVSAGAIEISSAVPIIMGANIGTTVTNTLVSMGHITRRDEFQRGFAAAIVHDIFNFLAVLILLPLEVFTGVLEKSATWLANIFSSQQALEFKSPVKAVVRPFSKSIQGILDGVLPGGEFALGIVTLVVAFIMIYFSLFFIVKILKRSLESKITTVIYGVVNSSAAVCMISGMLITALVQSSSITTSILVPLVACHVIELEHGFPITLGANVGTTVTALLAALAGGPAGLAIAFVHLLFNLVGILLIYPVRAIRAIPLRLATRISEYVSRNRYMAIVWVVVLFFLTPILLMWATGAF